MRWLIRRALLTADGSNPGNGQPPAPPPAPAAPPAPADEKPRKAEAAVVDQVAALDKFTKGLAEHVGFGKPPAGTAPVAASAAAASDDAEPWMPFSSGFDKHFDAEFGDAPAATK